MPKPEQFRQPDPHEEQRTVALEATVGSDVYNLRVEGSDLDWVHYVFPTLNDLYDRQQVSYERAADGDDHKYRDVRHLAHLLKKVNLNTLEALYSPRLVVHPSLGWLVDERDRLASLEERRQTAAQMRFAAVASILLLPALIVGYFGQNFTTLGIIGDWWTPPVSGLALFGITALQFSYFKWKKWL